MHVQELKLRLKFALQRLKLARQMSAFSRARHTESKVLSSAVSLGRRRGAGVYALLGDGHDQDAALPAQSIHDSDAPGPRAAGHRVHSLAAAGPDDRVKLTDALARSTVQTNSGDADPALVSEEEASELERQSVSKREHFGDRNPRRMKDVRLEQLHLTAAASTRFTQLSASDNIELPQFFFKKAELAAAAQKHIDDAGDYGFDLKISMFKSNLDSAKVDAKNAASTYTDAVLDVQDTQKQAMRLLKTLGSQIDRWHEASLSIVKLQHALAVAHQRDQLAMKRFIHAAQGALFRLWTYLTL